MRVYLTLCDYTDLISSRTVVITGSGGFVGSHVVRDLLARDLDVRVLDDLSTGHADNLVGLDIDLVEGSMLDLDAVARSVRGCTDVVHLAALGSVPRSVDNPLATHAANTTGMLNVLEACRAEGDVYVVGASSSSIYGRTRKLPTSERQAPMPISPYAVTKVATEGYLAAYSHCYGLETLSCRLFNVYGPRQRRESAYAKVIPEFIGAAFGGQPLTVHGSGKQSRDFTYVGDIAQAFGIAVERRVSSTSPVNAAFGRRIDLLTIVKLLEEQIGPLEVVHTETRRGDVEHTLADPKRFRRLFPELAPTAFEGGLELTVEWMRDSLTTV